MLLYYKDHLRHWRCNRRDITRSPQSDYRCYAGARYVALPGGLSPLRAGRVARGRGRGGGAIAENRGRLYSRRALGLPNYGATQTILKTSGVRALCRLPLGDDGESTRSAPGKEVPTVKRSLIGAAIMPGARLIAVFRSLV